MSGAPITSHGRGGAGNIAPDEKPYADGEIVREGPLGDQGDGAYSTGVSSAFQSSPYSLQLPQSSPNDSPPARRSINHLALLTMKCSQKRGGAGNIDSPRLGASKAATAGDSDVIPETATKVGAYENYHVGRGGEGNVHRDHPKEGHEHEGLAAKAKHLFHHEKKEGEGA